MGQTGPSLDVLGSGWPQVKDSAPAAPRWHVPAVPSKTGTGPAECPHRLLG